MIGKGHLVFKRVMVANEERESTRAKTSHGRGRKRGLGRNILLQRVLWRKPRMAISLVWWLFLQRENLLAGMTGVKPQTVSISRSR